MKESLKIYSRDFKEKAVLLSYQRGNIAQVEKELEISSSLLSRWRQDYEKFGVGSFPGSGYLRLSPQQRIIHDLEKKINESDSKFDILKNGSTYLCESKPMIFYFIESNEKKIFY